jgi:mucin-19
MKLLLPILSCCFVLTAGSFSSQAQDYTITTTGNAIVITDNSGNGETLTVSESGSNIRFVVTPNTRTYRINGGAITAFTTPADIALTGINSITINAAGGNDNINMGAFAANLPSLTINGGMGNDVVNFNGNINFAANASLDVDMQNDDATPGVDQVTVAANANLLLSGTGAVTVRVSQSVRVNAGGSMVTENGNLTVEANQQATATTGAFTGVTVTGAGSKLGCSGSGILTVNGRGGDFGTWYGVFVDAGGIITGGTAAVYVTGTGGNSTSDSNFGVYVTGTNSSITSSGGNLSVTGTGGGSGASGSDYGIFVGFNGMISAGGNGTVTVVGNGGTASTGNTNFGVYVSATNARITSSGGDVSVTGRGGGSGTSNQNIGVFAQFGGQITAGGSGTVTVVGNGGIGSAGGTGVAVTGANARITSSGGNVSVTGIESGGSGSVGIITAISGIITTTTNGGNITLIANSMSIEDGISTPTGNSVTLRPYTNGVQINLGSTNNPIGGPLSLSDAELDLISTGTLIIGDANSGAISISAAVSRPAATNLQLRSGGDITFNQHFNTGGGTLLLAPGNTPAAVKPTFTGTDATASTVSFASDLSIAINGTTAGDGTGSTYTRLTVAGSVDLAGVDLVFSGAYVPVLGNTFTIVDNDGADAIVNTFTGLVEGARISNFLASGLDATITYLGGDGNDVVLTVVAAPLPDYTITTTGNEIVITDISGNSETLTVSESGSNIRFVVTPNTRTYRINGGAITAFTTPADVALAGANAITINTAAGNDIINMGAFAANLPSLTINGGTGDDQVNFNGDIPFAANANLDVDMQNDDAAPGLDRVTIAANANLILTGTGTATVKVSRDVFINSGGSIETADGNLTVEANQQAMPSSGNFEGVRVNGGVLKISGIGLLDVKGKGGNSGANNRGVFVDNAGKIEGGSGTVTVQGTGGATSGNSNYGVWVSGANSRITSSGGAVSVTGQGAVRVLLDPTTGFGLILQARLPLAEAVRSRCRVPAARLRVIVTMVFGSSVPIPGSLHRVARSA